jgi:hypothetical protein
MKCALLPHSLTAQKKTLIPAAAVFIAFVLTACGGSNAPTTSTGWYQAGNTWSVNNGNLQGNGAMVGYTSADYCSAAIDQAGLISGNPISNMSWAGSTLPAPSPVPQSGSDAMSWISGCAAGVAPPAANTPAGAAPVPADSAPADSAAAPAYSAPVPAAAPTTPTPPPATSPVFGCYVNSNQPNDDELLGASINIISGGTGYSEAVVKVVILDKNGKALQTQTVTAYSSTENWQVAIDPEGGPSSLLTESTCTATVESAS